MKKSHSLVCLILFYWMLKKKTKSQYESLAQILLPNFLWDEYFGCE